ncbi:MAG TPA: hypothetical protein VFV96_07790 [Verrucomicrobiae bacterium]|nr:hypothetical protein [Verrucomicrobiae bacterium]
MRRHRIQTGLWAIVLFGWASYALLGGRLAHWMGDRFGGLLLRIGQNKFNDAVIFAQGRMREFLWLFTLAMAWAALQTTLNRVLSRRPRLARHRWAVHGIAGFVMLNLWLAAAGNTALFWGVMGAGAGVQNYMQFQFKRVVFEENRAPLKAVLVGSSQTRAEIDENELNRRLGTNLWTSELHFPGSKAYDLLLIEPSLRRANPQLVICYLTLGYFYQGSHGEVPPNFLTLTELPDAWRRGALTHLSGREIGCGLLGDMLPVFRYRDVLSQRLLGSEALNLRQTEYDDSLNTNLDVRAVQMACTFRLNEESDFQKHAFEDLVRRCERTGRTMILIEGGHNPILERHLDPAIRRDMVRFLSGLQSSHSNVVVIPTTDLPIQTPQDYDDLSHVSPDMQRKFTGFMAGWLERYLARPRNPQVTPAAL